MRIAPSRITSKIQTLVFYGSRKLSTKTPNPVLETLRTTKFRHPPSSPSDKTFCSFAPTSFVSSRYFNAGCAEEDDPERIVQMQNKTNDEVEPIDFWEEEDEDEAEPEIGDGGAGGGVVLQNCPWGECALSIAREVLLHFGDDMELFAFKTTPRDYIYVRLDRLSDKYGCPSMDNIESYSRQYKERLDEVGVRGDIPSNLALEVSSPGANRLLRVPDDLERFRELPMTVCYVEGDDSGSPQKNGIFLVDSIDTKSATCVWRLADVKENRDASGKGRPLSRKKRDWRLELPNAMLRRVTLYLDY